MITVSRRPLSVASFADMALFAAFCIASMLLAVSIQLGPYGVPTRSAVLFAVEFALITTAVGTMFGIFRSGERKSLGTVFGRTVLAMGVGVPICYVIFGLAPQGAGPRAVLPYAALFTVSLVILVRPILMAALASSRHALRHALINDVRRDFRQPVHVARERKSPPLIVS